jgi:succinate dehydrogenase / fumarate reductase flavoprotein subunit
LAGAGAAEYVRKLSGSCRTTAGQISDVISRAVQPLNRESGVNPYIVHEELQDVMQRYVGIVRTESELKQALELLDKLKKEASKVKADGTSQYNPGWHEALSLRNLLISAEAVTHAALTRQESRGAHTRLDFPGEAEEWLKYNVVIRKGKDGRMEVKKIKRPEPPRELAEIAYAKIEELEASHEVHK